MKIVFALMNWKRELNELAACIEKVQEHYDVEVIVVGSEGKVSRLRAEDFGFDYYEHPNKPLYKKAQYRMEALRKYDFDFCVLLGDDNLFNVDFIHYLVKRIKLGYELVASFDVYYLVNNYSYYFNGYEGARCGEPMSIGRAISKDLLDRMNYKVWSEVNNMSIDRNSNENILKEAKTVHLYRMKYNSGKLWNKHDETNLTKFNNGAKKSRDKETDKAIRTLLDPQ